MLWQRAKYFLLFLVNTSSFAGQAQEWKKDLEAMNKAYYQARSFSAEVVVSTYENSGDVKPMIQTKGKVAKMGPNYFSLMMNRTVIQNKQYYVVVDEGQGVILYKKYKPEENLDQQAFNELIDSSMSFLNDIAKVTYLENTSKVKRILIAYEDLELESIEFVINPANNTMKQVIYLYREKDGQAGKKARVVIDYKQTVLNGTIDESLFSEKKYLQKKGGKLIATQKYSQYKVFNQDEEIAP